MMNKRIAVLFLVTVAVGAIFWFNAIFSDWFGQKKIQIMCRIIPARNAAGAKGPIITFYLPKRQPLTSVKVSVESEARTNKFPHALWHLQATTEAPMVESFVYGVDV